MLTPDFWVYDLLFDRTGLMSELQTNHIIEFYLLHYQEPKTTYKSGKMEDVHQYSEPFLFVETRKMQHSYVVNCRILFHFKKISFD